MKSKRKSEVKIGIYVLCTIVMSFWPFGINAVARAKSNFMNSSDSVSIYSRDSVPELENIVLAVNKNSMDIIPAVVLAYKKMLL